MIALAVGAAALWAGAGCSARSASVRSRVNPVAASVPQLQVRTVVLPFRSYGMARVVGTDLYATVDSGTGLLDTLLRYDLKTGTSVVVFKVPADIAWVAVNERWLVWESEKKLYAEPTRGGPRQVLATSREAYGPALEGDVVAWVDHEEGSDPRIVTFNLQTREKREVARTRVAEFYNNFMQLRDGKLLWTDIYEGTGHYVLYDLATRETETYPMPATRFRYPGYAVRSGDSIYSINFDRYDQWDWSSQQAGRFSVADGRFKPITKSGQYINSLVAGINAVAVIDAEQRLLVGPADGSSPDTDLSGTLAGQVDAVQVSSDGVTAVAGRSLPEQTKSTLAIFELR